LYLLEELAGSEKDWYGSIVEQSRRFSKLVVGIGIASQTGLGLCKAKAVGKGRPRCQATSNSRRRRRKMEGLSAGEAEDALEDAVACQPSIAGR